jgi:hypothetical protein
MQTVCSAQALSMQAVTLPRALARLKYHGVFIGLTDYYPETVCLFHRMVCNPGVTCLNLAYVFCMFGLGVQNVPLTVCVSLAWWTYASE